MDKKYTIGIIGKGFVGTAVAHGFSQGVGYDANILIYDKDPSKSQNTLKEVVDQSDLFFVSVPTPSNKDGSINLHIVDNVIDNINNISSSNNPIILLRSTIYPRHFKENSKKISCNKDSIQPRIFDRKRVQFFDFLSQTRYVLGGESEDTKKVANLYRDRFGKTISIIETDFESA